MASCLAPRQRHMTRACVLLPCKRSPGLRTLQSPAFCALRLRAPAFWLGASLCTASLRHTSLRNTCYHLLAIPGCAAHTSQTGHQGRACVANSVTVACRPLTQASLEHAWPHTALPAHTTRCRRDLTLYWISAVYPACNIFSPAPAERQWQVCTGRCCHASVDESTGSDATKRQRRMRAADGFNELAMRTRVRDWGYKHSAARRELCPPSRSGRCIRLVH